MINNILVTISKFYFIYFLVLDIERGEINALENNEDKKNGRLILILITKRSMLISKVEAIRFPLFFTLMAVVSTLRATVSGKLNT